MKIKNGLLLLTALSLMISLSSCDPKKNSGSSSNIEPSSNIIIDSSSEEPVSSSEDIVSSDVEESSSTSEESSAPSSSSSNLEDQTFTVTWKNYNGEILEIDYKVKYGSTPSYDFETPTRAEDNEYKYVFIGWTPAITPVTSNQTYTATYNPVAKN